MRFSQKMDSHGRQLPDPTSSDAQQIGIEDLEVNMVKISTVKRARNTN